MDNQAIITGDIVESSSLEMNQRKALLKSLKAFFEKMPEGVEDEIFIKNSFEIFRGDSFQGFVLSIEESLRFSLLLRVYLMSEFHSGMKLDARIAIGIGKPYFKAKKIIHSDGEAFQNSGRLLDNMKNLPQKIALQSPILQVNEELNVGLILLESIISKWTNLQADVIFLKLKGFTEVVIAQRLGIAQSAVNQRSKAAGWAAVDAFLKRYHQVIKQNFVSNL
ncbi:MAG: hypothetical protein KA313_03890 [Pseudarcicella sp.]|nr:hypothetical protein [Pseudarcicella sp.]MBP6410217.1 hypothetical protein [Pseudarcicella sp.]